MRVLSENQYHEKQRSDASETGASEGEETRVWQLWKEVRHEGTLNVSPAHLQSELTTCGNHSVHNQDGVSLIRII